ncbi:hypothetical protein [Natrinema sp. 74]|uniref:hypothetical protein n=1 Tax=Natrinema sp. 74 TaxID=3384159 RepID=UPI0038D46CCE
MAEYPADAKTATPRAPRPPVPLETLESAVDGPYVIMLDEAAVIPDLDVLADRDLQLHFHGDSQIRFGTYHVDERVDIFERAWNMAWSRL